MLIYWEVEAMKVFFLKMLLILDCAWSNFYRVIELLFLPKELGKLKRFQGGQHPHLAWQVYCRATELKHYGRDKWYMGFEVISLPERFLARKVGDCDDFAVLGHWFFNEIFEFDGARYKFQGYFCIWSNDFKFMHWVAIYKNSANNGQPKYFRVSNFNAMFVGEICEGFHLDKKHKGLFAIGHITESLDCKLRFKAIYKSENEVNL